MMPGLADCAKPRVVILHWRCWEHVVLLHGELRPDPVYWRQSWRPFAPSPRPAATPAPPRCIAASPRKIPSESKMVTWGERRAAREVLYAEVYSVHLPGTVQPNKLKPRISVKRMHLAVDVEVQQATRAAWSCDVPGS